MMRKTLLAVVAAATLAVPSFGQAVRVRNLSASTSVLDVEQLQGAAQPVQLSRYLFAGYNTLCLPLTLSAAQLQDAARDVRVERLAAMAQEGATLCLYFVDCTADGIEAGTPYLVYSPAAQYLRARTTDAEAVSTQLRPVSLADQQGNRVTFSSSWQSLQGNGRYGIPARQGTDILESILQPTDAGKTFLPTRCGFTWNEQAAGATSLEIKHAASLAELPTAIRSLAATADTQADAYDLAGRRVKGTQRGIIVVDGAKKAVR